MLKKKITKGIAVVTLSLGLVFSGTSATVAPIGTTVTVEAASKNMSVKASNKNVYVGSSAKLNVKATKGAKLSYKTSNKKIATIDNKGNIKGRKAGTAKITITAKKSKYKTVKKTITVKVSKAESKNHSIKRFCSL